MPTVEARLTELLERWQAARRRGVTIPVESLCNDCPELEGELRRRIEQSSLLPAGDKTGDSDPRPSGSASSVVSSSALDLAGYELFGELGHGGMGVVYRAYDKKRRRLVAIKVMQHCGPSALYRFKQEFRALADVSHPNLVSLYELVSDGRTWFFTMELVNGFNFLDQIRRREESPESLGSGALPATDEPTGPSESGHETLVYVGAPSPRWERLRDALRQLSRGVSALHEKGILHRDIKPMNVLVEPGGRVVLLDFGLAAELEPSGLHQSTETHVLGTIAYMSPEQAAGRPISPASDWYCVGVMLYEALTGALPFSGKPQDVLMAKQQAEPPAPHALEPEVPADLDALCTELLRRDPGGRPDGAEVLRRLGVKPEGPDVSRPPRGPRLPLIGRDRHLRVLADAFSSMTEGRAITLFVHGSSGAGKSALVQNFLDDLVTRDAAVVLAGRCHERESVPYKALDSLIDALGRYLGRLPGPEVVALLPRDVLSLARVFPVLQRVGAVAAAPQRASEVPDPQELRRRAFAALRDLLGRLGDRRPLVLAIDDLQWGDIDSAALLADLLRPPDAPVLLMLGSYRSEDATTSPLLRLLLAPPEASQQAVDRRVLAIEPLTSPEVEELALQLLGSNDPAAHAGAKAIAHEAGGSPFFVQELVRYVQAGAGLAGRPSPGEGMSLDSVLWDRVLHLPEGARLLLEVVAVSGQPLKQEDAFQAAGLGAECLEALAVLRSGRLIRGTGPSDQGEVETYHDRVRETVVAHLSADVLAGHHLRLAEVLETSGIADPEALAVHFQGAKRPEKAGDYYALAAEQAAGALAFEHAAKLYRLALELRRSGDEDACERASRVSLGDALANAGRGSEAAREYLAAATRAEAAESIELRRRAAFQYLISGHIDKGLVELRTALRGIGMRLPSSPGRALLALIRERLLIRLRGLGFHERRPDEIAPNELLRIDICDSASVGLGVVDPICGAAVQARTLLLALRAGEPARIARALAWEACHVSTAGGPSRRRTVRLLQTGDALAKRVAHPRVFGAMALARGISAYTQGDWKESLKHSDRAESILRELCTGVAWELDTAHTFSLWALTYMGEVSELTRRCRILLREAEERGDLYALTNLSTYIMAIVQLGADNPEEARRELSEAVRRWSQEGFHIQHHNALLARMYIDLYSGDGTAAWHHISERWPAYSSSLLLRVQQVRIDVLQLRARSALSGAITALDPRPLFRSAERDARRLERERVSWAQAHAAYLRAALAQVRGDSTAARAGLTHANSLYVAADMPLYAAAARRRLGGCLGGEAGKAMVAEADACMSSQSIRNPARMAAMYAPGAFPD